MQSPLFMRHDNNGIDGSHISIFSGPAKPWHLTYTKLSWSTFFFPYVVLATDSTCSHTLSSSLSPRSMASPLPIFLILSSLSTLSAAYTWNFVSPPKQCSNLTISLVGSGVPPYSLLVLPSGPTPLSSGIEVRRILNVPFSGNSVSFMFNYPAYSGFVAVVSITPYFLFFFFSSYFLFLSFSLLFSMLSSLSMSHLSMLGSSVEALLMHWSRSPLDPTFYSHLALLYDGEFTCHFAPCSTLHWNYPLFGCPLIHSNPTIFLSFDSSLSLISYRLLEITPMSQEALRWRDPSCCPTLTLRY